MFSSLKASFPFYPKSKCSFFIISPLLLCFFLHKSLILLPKQEQVLSFPQWLLTLFTWAFFLIIMQGQSIRVTRDVVSEACILQRLNSTLKYCMLGSLRTKDCRKVKLLSVPASSPNSECPLNKIHFGSGKQQRDLGTTGLWDSSERWRAGENILKEIHRTTWPAVLYKEKRVLAKQLFFSLPQSNPKVIGLGARWSGLWAVKHQRVEQLC